MQEINWKNVSLKSEYWFVFFKKEGRQATQKIWEEEMYDLITGRHFRQAEKKIIFLAYNHFYKNSILICFDIHKSSLTNTKHLGWEMVQNQVPLLFYEPELCESLM